MRAAALVLANTGEMDRALELTRSMFGYDPAAAATMLSQIETLVFDIDGPQVLLIRKKRGLGAGKINGPGGRLEAGETPEQCAIRETHEEVGIDPQLVSIAGYLPPSPTVTGYSVTPVVGLVADGVAIRIDPSEVDAAFEVPLEFLMERRNQRYSEREFEGVMLQIVEFHYQERRIWGATASMLLQLRKLII